VGEVFPKCEGLLSAHAEGKDPFGDFLRAMKQTGREMLITYRMNDVHGATDPSHPGASSFKRQHPEFMVNPGADGSTGGWMDYCLDYARPEVREYYLRTIRELIELYADTIDGIQLDWMRFPRHLSGPQEQAWAQREALTEMTQGVKEALRASGRKLLLGARIPSNLPGCRNLGTDIAEWTRRGLVDYLVATSFLNTDYYMPLSELREEIRPSAVPIYTDIEISHCNRQYHNPESLRAVALSHYDCGSDGLYVFNFPCWTQLLPARPYHWFEGLESPEGAGRKPLLFSATHRRVRIGGIDLPGLLPRPIKPGETLEVPIYLPERAFPFWRALVLVAAGGDVAVDVNGRQAQENPYLHRSVLFVEHSPRYEKDDPEANLGENCRVFHAKPDCWTPGWNSVRVRNTSEEQREARRVNVGLW
jgi:hypothetical protein